MPRRHRVRDTEPPGIGRVYPSSCIPCRGYRVGDTVPPARCLSKVRVTVSPTRCRSGLAVSIVRVIVSATRRRALRRGSTASDRCIKRQGDRSPCQRHSAAWARLYPASETPCRRHGAGPLEGSPLVYVEGVRDPYCTVSATRCSPPLLHGVVQRRGAHLRSPVGQSRGGVVHAALTGGAQRGGLTRQAHGPTHVPRGGCWARPRSAHAANPPAPEARTSTPRLTRVSGAPALQACAGKSAARRVTTPVPR